MSNDIKAKVEELKQKYIGTIGEPTVMEVEWGSIKRFAQAVGDQNPLWNDAEFARKTEYGQVICPPGFFGWAAKSKPGLSGLTAKMMGEFAVSGFPGVLDGGMEYEFNIPIHPGDIIISSGKIADIYAKEGRTGASIFGVVEITYTNQNGDVVAKSRATLIGRQA